MDKRFAAANTDSDVIYLFKEALRLSDATQVRCAHAAGIAVALGMCRVDAVILLAAREAARATNAGYRLVLETCLPATAHIILGGKLLLLSVENGNCKVRRRFNSRENLIDRILEACSPDASVWGQSYANRITSGYEPIGRPTHVDSCTSVEPTVSLASAQVIIASDKP